MQITKSTFFFFLLLFCARNLSATIIESEDFNGGILPAGWTATINTGGTNWEVGTAGFYTCTSGGQQSPGGDMSGFVYFDDDCPGQNAPVANVMLFSPVSDISGAGIATLSFDYVHIRGLIAGMFESFNVEVFDGTGWVSVLTSIPLVDENTNGNPISLDVTAQANAAFQVRFTYDDGGQDPANLLGMTWGGGFGMDNFLLETFAANGVITNDDCDNATVITCGTPIAGTTVGAMADTNLGIPCTGDLTVNTGLVGVWYSYTPTTPENVTLSLCNAATDFDAQIRVFTRTVPGADCTLPGSLQCELGNDDSGADCPLDPLHPIVNLNMDANTEYLIYIGGFLLNEGNFSLESSCTPIPNNDDCVNATPIDCGTPIAGTTLGASEDLNLGTPCTGDLTVNTGVVGVWYSYTPAADEALTLSLCDTATDFDAQIRVYTNTLGLDCSLPGSLQCEIGNDDAGAACAIDPLHPIVTVNVDAGTEYLIYVGGFLTNTGNFSLESICTERPNNDDCVNATPITCDETLTGTTAGATSDIGLNGVSAICANGDNNTNTSTTGVFYSFTGTGQNVTVSTCSPNTMTDTQIRVLTGSCTDFLDPLTCVSGNDDIFTCPSGGTQSIVNFDSDLGTEYLFFVSQSGPSQGGDLGGVFDISVTCQDNPANDDCADAIVVSCGDVVSGTTEGAMTDVGLAGATAACADGDGNTNNSVFGVFYSYTGTGDIVTVTTCSPNTETDTQMRIVTGSCTDALDPLLCVTGNDDDAGCTNGTFMSTATFESVLGEEYLIYISAAGAINGADAGGAFELSISCAPNVMNDDCVDATPIDCNSGSITGSTVGANIDLNAALPCTGDITNNVGVQGVWYSTTGNGQVLRLSLCNAATDFDAQIRVFTGDCTDLLDPLVCVTGNDDNPACDLGALNPEVVVPTVNGEVYYIYIGGFLTNEGNFQLDIECTDPPTNDDCADAETVICGDVVTGTTLGATSDVAINSATGICADGDGNTNTSTVGVFYTYVGTGDIVTVTTCSPNTVTDTQIRVATGSCTDALDPLVCVTGNDDDAACGNDTEQSTVTFTSTQGEEYFFFVSQSGPSQGGDNGGVFELSITCVPSAPINDDCDDAVPITCGDVIQGDTENANLDNSINAATAACLETDLTSAGVEGVFYSYVGTGELVTITTCSPNTVTDTQIRVATGSCDGVTDPIICVAGNDDDPDCAANGLASTVTFGSVVGEEYLIYVSKLPFPLGDGGGVFELSITCEPLADNDDCTGAIPITCDSQTLGTTTGAAPDVIPAAPCGDLVSNVGATGVWYQFMGDGQIWNLSTCNDVSDFDTQIRVFTPLVGSDCTLGLNCVAGNDEDGDCATNGSLSTVDFETTDGEMYFVFVGGFLLETGDFRLDVECRPAPADNDSCDDRDPIACGETLSGTTVGAEAPPLPFTVTCLDVVSVNPRGAWYSYTGTGAFATFTLCEEAGFDGRLTVLTGDCLAPVCLESSNDFAGCAEGQEEVGFQGIDGIEYFIFITNVGGTEGAFDLTLECIDVPVNDDCGDATPISCDDVIIGNTIAASLDNSINAATAACVGLDATNAGVVGVFYTYTGTGDIVTLSTCSANTETDTQIRVLTGSCDDVGNPLLCVAANDDDADCAETGTASTVTFLSEENTVYTIYISRLEAPLGDGGGQFELSMTCVTPPVNDDCEDALPIACGETLTGTTTNSTVDLQLANPTTFCVNGDTGDETSGEGVWYSITGTGQIVNLTTCNPGTDPNNDTQIRVFTSVTGMCNVDLICEAGNDDDGNCASNPLASTVEFTATLGTEYLVFVGRPYDPTGLLGVNEGGIFELSMTCTDIADNDDCTSAIPLSCNTVVSGNTAEATVDLQLASPTSFCINGDIGDETGGIGLWYTFEGNGQTVNFSTCSDLDGVNTPADNDTQIRVFTSTTGMCEVPGDLMCTEANDNDANCGNGLQSTVDVATIDGEIYYIFVARQFPLGAGGPFDLAITALPDFAICPNDITEVNDAGDCGAIVDFNVIGREDCTETTGDLITGQASGTLFPVGTTPVTYQVTDSNGETATCSFNVTVNDTEAPVAICQDITVQLDGTGTATVMPEQINNASTDNCAVTMLMLDQTTFTAAGTFPVNLTATDAAGNSDMCAATVTVIEAVDETPVAVCQDITVQLDNMGMVSIQASDTDGGSTPAGANLSIDISDFTCDDIGANTVTLTVENAGETDMCTATVTVEDDENPMAICSDITVEVSGSGATTITAADVDNSSTDNCTVAMTSIDNTTFTCAEIGTQSTTLTVTDGAGNTDMCTAVVTVEEANDLTAVCLDITVQLDADGMVSIAAADLDGGSTGGCNAMLSADPTDFTCDNLGANDVTLTVSSGGNSDMCTAVVTVEDDIPPVAVCMDITVQISAGSITIDGADVDGGSTDNCDASLTFEVDPDTFTCDDLGANTVTLTVTDGGNNSDMCTAVVTVEENAGAVSAVCQDITIQLDDNGTAMITAQDVDGGSTGGCMTTLSIDVDMFDCDSLGDNDVVLTVSGSDGTSDMCTAVVTVEDSGNVTAVCQDIIVQLDGNGMVSVTADDVDGGSNGGCNEMLSIDMSDFTCDNIGDNDVILTVSDGTNSDMCTAVVTVQNNEMPVAVCQDITVQLDANGMVTITAADVDGGSTANCPVTLSIDNGNFDCTNVGPNTVMLAVSTPNNGNGNTNAALCNATVTVEDDTPPAAMCMDITVEVTAGSVTIDGEDVDGGSTDNCSGSLTFDVDPATFTCDDLGANNVTLTVSDPSGNSDMCTAVVTVEEGANTVMAVCQNITVTLDADSTATIEATDTDGGSTGGCDVTLSIDVSMFDCDDIGDNDVVLTVEDNNGTTDMCTAIVTVEEGDGVDAVCQNITVQLAADGTVMIVAADVDGGSSTGCDGMLSIDNDTFACEDLGDNVVMLTVESNGTSDMCAAIVTVEEGDNVDAVCMDITVELAADGMVSITADDVDGGSLTGCGDGGMIEIDMSDFTCDNIGDNDVILTVTSAAGNTDMCTAVVTVEDNNAPAAMCQNITVEVDEPNTVTVAAEDVDNGSSATCGEVMLSLAPNMFDCNDFGDNTVTLTATAENGMMSSCEATITIVCNPICPIEDFVCRQPTSTTTDLGSCELSAVNMLDPFVITPDDCVPADISITSDLQLPAQVGTTVVTYSLDAPFGQSMTCTTELIVSDGEAPDLNCRSGGTMTIDLTSGCSISAAQIPTPTATDNCTANVSVSLFGLGSYGVGSHPLAFIATDEAGNTTICNRTLTVRDVTAPTFTSCPQNVTAQVTGDDCDATVNFNTPNAFDSCGEVEFIGSHDSGDTFPVGTTAVTYLAIDESGNTATCEFNVTVTNNQPVTFEGCPEDFTVISNDGGSVEAFFDMPTVTAGNCEVTPLVNVQSGDLFPVGDTEVVISYGEFECTFTLTVEQGARIVCPQNFVVNIQEGQDSVFIEWNEPYGSTICDMIPDTVDTALYDHIGNFEGHDYYIFTFNEITWESARTAAETAGGHLVKITSAEENQFVTNEMLPYNKAWIGAEDDNTEGTFRWTDGDTLTYTNWAIGAPNVQSEHPDSIPDFNDYVLLNSDGTWDDANVNSTHYFIMEIPTYEIEQIYPFFDTLPNSTFFYPGDHQIWYELTDTCGNIDICSFHIFVNEYDENESDPLVYCNIKTQDTTAHRYIQSVSIGSYANVSGDNQGFAVNYEDNVTMIQGDTVNLYLEADDDSLSIEDYLYWNVWFDFNRDGDFYDTGELIFSAENVRDTLTQIVLPYDAEVYDIRPRLRITASTTDTPDPCGYLRSGETEDYRFRYLNPDLEPPVQYPGSVLGMQAEISPNPSNGYIRLTVQDAPAQPGQVTVKDVTGRTVFVKLLNDVAQESLRLDLTHLPTGNYFMTIQTNGELITEQLYIGQRP